MERVCGWFLKRVFGGAWGVLLLAQRSRWRVTALGG